MPTWISEPEEEGGAAPQPSASPRDTFAEKTGQAGQIGGSAAQTLKARLVAEARAVGFSACGIAAPDAIPKAAGRLADWLGAGHHGQMAWMADRAG